jgi:hypothetical protein
LSGDHQEPRSKEKKGRGEMVFKIPSIPLSFEVSYRMRVK